VWRFSSLGEIQGRLNPPSYLQQFVNSGFLVAIFCGLFVFFSHEERETQDSSELSPLLDQHVLGGQLNNQTLGFQSSHFCVPEVLLLLVLPTKALR
jgi:hypothetical protein